MEKFDIIPIIKLILKKWILLLSIALVCAAIAFGYCKFFATPRYSATGSILVTNGAIIMNEKDPYEEYNNYVSNNDIVASMNIVDTVVDILKTPGIYKEMATNLPEGSKNYSYRQLLSAANIKGKNTSSLFVNVTFTATDAKEAVNLVNSYLDLAPDYISGFVPNMKTTVSDADIASQIFPRTFFFTFIAGVVGAVATFLVVLFIFLNNTIIQNEEDFRDRFDIPVIAVIPNFEKAKSNHSSNYKSTGKGIY